MSFTKLYLTNLAAPYTPATIRGTWDVTGSAVTKAISPSKTGGGAITSVAVAEAVATNPYNVLLYRGVSGPLAAQTINCNIDVILGLMEANADADFYAHLHVYVTQGNSDTPRGTLINDYLENTTNEFPASPVPLGRGLQSPQATGSLAISAGDRLVIEFGYVARNSHTTSRAGTLWYGTQDPTTFAEPADLAVGGTNTAGLVGSITFSAAITEGNNDNRYSQLGAEVGSGGSGDSIYSQIGVEVASPTGTSPQRYSQLGAEVGHEGNPGQIYTQIGVEIAQPNIEEEIEFQGGGEVDIGHTWMEVTDKLGTLRVHSKVALPDRHDYYGGFKDDRVVQWGRLTRALSDRAGQFEAAQFTAITADTDRLYRGLADADATRVIKNRPVTVRMIDDVSRRLFLKPRTMMKGIVRGYEPLAPMLWQWTLKDILAAKFSPDNTKDQLPNRLIARADFPDCPTDKINRPVPIVYGFLSDAGSVTPAPIIYSDPAIGAVTVSPLFPVAGYGPLTSAAAVPTGVTVGLAAGGTLNTDVPNGEYGVIVTAVDVNGLESDPQTFYYSGPNIGRGSFASTPLYAAGQVVSPNGTEKIQVSWSAAAGAVAYRIYLGWYYFGTRFTQYIEVAAPTLSCEFIDSPAWGDPISPSNITAGANLINFGQFWWYAVTAMMADGETAQSVVVFGASGPYRRPMRIEWLPVPGALGYKVYRRGLAAWDRVWSVASSQNRFDDDLFDTGATYIDGAPSPMGQVPVIPVGTKADSSGAIWNVFLVAGHAVTEITDVFQNGVLVDSGKFGITWAVPGKTGYSTYFPNTGTTQYLDINGHRYTLLFVRGPDAVAALDGTGTITLNVKGIEDAGDSSGSLITDGLLQYRHAVINWVLQSYLTGNWFSAPVFADEPTLTQINEASFVAASAVAQSRIAGGYEGAWMLGAAGERITIRDFVAQQNVSWDVDSGFDRKTRFFVSMVDERIATLNAARFVSDVRDIYEDSFRSTPVDSELFNRYPAVYSRDYTGKRPTGWNATIDRSDAASISELDGEEKSSPELQLHGVRNALQAEDVVYRRLTRTKQTPMLVVWDMGMAGLSIEIGDVVKVTAYSAIGDQGYVDRPIRVTRHEVDPDKFTVTIEGYDMERLFAGMFTLGDEGSLPAAWTSAVAGERSYGYLCDDTTGQFSDGAAGKRLR